MSSVQKIDLTNELKGRLVNTITTNVYSLPNFPSLKDLSHHFLHNMDILRYESKETASEKSREKGKFAKKFKGHPNVNFIHPAPTEWGKTFTLGYPSAVSYYISNTRGYQASSSPLKRTYELRENEHCQRELPPVSLRPLHPTKLTFNNELKALTDRVGMLSDLLGFKFKYVNRTS